MSETKHEVTAHHIPGEGIQFRCTCGAVSQVRHSAADAKKTLKHR